MEGAGEFAALNLNTDRAGLSFGLLQWAQKPGRLAERLAVFRTANTDQFAEIFGGSDTANRLMKRAPKTNGGISPAAGETTDPAFDLIREPWISRFRRAASSRAFQKVQVETAMASFRNSHESLCHFAPELCSGAKCRLHARFGKPVRQRRSALHLPRGSPRWAGRSRTAGGNRHGVRSPHSDRVQEHHGCAQMLPPDHQLLLLRTIDRPRQYRATRLTPLIW